MNVSQYFRELRFDTRHHLGLGDIRITMAQQEEIVSYVKKLEDRLGIEHKDMFLFGSES